MNYTELSKEVSYDNFFKDDGRDIYDFQNKFLVKCKICGNCATIIAIPKYEGSYFVYKERKFICTGCGKIEIKSVMNGIGSEYPLWLETNCCGHKLWAYNLEHLNYIESFVRANLRENYYDERIGWKNQSLASRLPKWMKKSSNREAILKSIGILKRRI